MASGNGGAANNATKRKIQRDGEKQGIAERERVRVREVETEGPRSMPEPKRR